MKKTTKEIKRVADIIENRLIDQGVVVQRYDSYTTNSVYFKFDGGLANSLRIGDHQGKQYLNYMFMVDVRHSGKVKVTRNQFFQYTYGPQKRQLTRLVDHILRHRQKRISGYDTIFQYREAIKKQFESNAKQRGFWKQSRLIEGKQMEWLHENIREISSVVRQ